MHSRIGTPTASRAAHERNAHVSRPSGQGGAADKLGTSAREVALHVVRDVFGPQARGAQAAFEVRAKRLDARDRAFAAELAYGSIKQRRLLDWRLEPYVGDRRKPLTPSVAEVLRLGAYQLQFMSGVEDHAAISQSVNLAWHHGHKGTAGLVNAVLRRMQADGPRVAERSHFENDADFLGTAYSVPTWLAAHYLATLGPATPAALAGVNRAPRAALRVNTLRGTRHSVSAELALHGVTTQPSPYVPETLLIDAGAVADDAAGRWTLQSEAAAMPVDLLAPQPGEDVLELCSGRGNKTLQIAARLSDRGRLLCIDCDAAKMAVLTARLERAGMTQVTTVLGDAGDTAGPMPSDAVLVDAPCSASGVIGRHPEARWRKRCDDAARLGPVQRALLAAAAAHTKPGGRLVYSVCSIDAREGRHIVDAFLADAPSFARATLPERYAPFNDAGDVLVAPGIEGRDGFYIATLTHRGASAMSA